MFAPVPFSPHPPFSTAALGPQPPTADFSGTPTSGTAPLSVTFTDLSTGSPTSWLWDFGDGNTDTTENPVHVYTVAGTYTVKLTATNANGSNTKTRTNYINASVVPQPSVTLCGGVKKRKIVINLRDIENRQDTAEFLKAQLRIKYPEPPDTSKRDELKRLAAQEKREKAMREKAAKLAAEEAAEQKRLTEIHNDNVRILMLIAAQL